MLNLLRMEIRKLFRDKGLYITMAVFFGILVIAFVTLKLMSSSSLMEWAIDNGFEFSVQDQADTQEFLNSTQIDFLSNLLFSGGLMAALAGITSSILTCSDFATGFSKNIFFLLSGQKILYYGKAGLPLYHERIFYGKFNSVYLDTIPAHGIF